MTPAQPAADWNRAPLRGEDTSPAREIARQGRSVRTYSALLILLCLGTLGLQFKHIAATMPYPRHVDEPYVSGPANRTVQTGTFHPYSYNYPSLPKYLAAAGMAAGFIRGAGRMEIREIRHIGSVEYPYYAVPRVMQTARQLFAFLAMLAVAATGWSAWLAFRRPATILVAPLLLVSSPLFFEDSWTYLNVDIIGTCFVTLALTACLVGTRRPSVHQSGAVSGTLVGLAVASKYTLAVSILPVLAAIALFMTGTRRVWTWGAAIAAMVLAFVVAMPYSLLDIPQFLNGIAFEAFHYASGHRGFNGEPGFDQLFYYLRHFVTEFGAAALLAPLGLVLFAVSDKRRAAILTALPVALLWLLSSQRVHFPRNVLSLHPQVALFAAFALVRLHDGAMAQIERRGWRWGGGRRRMRTAVAFVLLVLAVPVWHIGENFRDRTDSRNLALTYLRERLPAGWAIAVPSQLAFDARPLEALGRTVVTIDLQSASNPEALSAVLAGVPRPAVILVPRWGADERFGGAARAAPLNEIAKRWKPMLSFGTKPVLVNYSYPVPQGDPAFSVASVQ